ncbi:MAG: hypothetical protein K1X81_13925 [Bacteroidia bacterium]|nr:hypothetical protein [Bacteroidia bacterium]
MKHLNLVLLLIAFSSLGLHCKKEPDEPKTELEKLPPLTMEGKQTFGWLANGKAIIGNLYGWYADYQNGVFELSGGDQILSTEGNHISILVDQYQINKKGTYLIPITKKIGSNTYFSAQFNSILPSYESIFTDHGYATINIYRLDTINYYMAGTFAFTVYSQFGDSLVITDGRFDFKYH